MVNETNKKLPPLRFWVIVLVFVGVESMFIVGIFINWYNSSLNAQRALVLLQLRSCSMIARSTPARRPTPKSHLDQLFSLLSSPRIEYPCK